MGQDVMSPISIDSIKINADRFICRFVLAVSENVRTYIVRAYTCVNNRQCWHITNIGNETIVKLRGRRKSSTRRATAEESRRHFGAVTSLERSAQDSNYIHTYLVELALFAIEFGTNAFVFFIFSTAAFAFCSCIFACISSFFC